MYLEGISLLIFSLSSGRLLSLYNAILTQKLTYVVQLTRLGSVMSSVTTGTNTMAPSTELKEIEIDLDENWHVWLVV